MRDPGQGLATTRTSRLEDVRALVAATSAEAWVRLAAAALAPLLHALTAPIGTFWLPLVLLGYVLLTTRAAVGPRLTAADVAAGTLVVAGLGGRALPVLAFLLVTVATAGRRHGVGHGTTAGLVVAAVLFGSLAATARLEDVGMPGALATSLLFPLVGATAASLARLVGQVPVRDRVVLQEANRLLSSLRSIADHLPGGLDVATVSAALVAEIRALTTSPAVLVLVEDGGLLEPTAAVGVPHGSPRRVRLDELRHQAATTTSSARFLTPQGLPTALRPAAAGARHWTVLGLGPPDRPVGVVLVGFDDLDAGRAARARLVSVATDAGIALDNARLFDGTQARAADTARRRLAGDLHDGVAQSLAHLRMELELRSLAAEGDDRREMDRLARLARHTLQELRATISDLRRPLDGDIDVQLRRHIDRLTSASAPSLEFESYGRAEVDPERTEQVLRVAQEALSNALRHARATRITVTLERDAAVLELVVEDDGVGLAGPSPEAGGGVGLRSMRERAAALGGAIDVRDRVGGGTVVHLRCPTARPVPDARAGRPR